MKAIEYYKGAEITPAIYSGYWWRHPKYEDADWTGDGWERFGMGHEPTIEECKEAIDRFFEDNPELIEILT